MVLKARAAVATSDGPPSGKGGAFTSRPSRSAASAKSRTGRVSRRTAHSVKPAAVAVITRKAAKKVSECQGRGCGSRTRKFSHSPSGKRSEMAKWNGPPRPATRASRARHRGGPAEAS